MKWDVTAAMDQTPSSAICPTNVLTKAKFVMRNMTAIFKRTKGMRNVFLKEKNLITCSWRFSTSQLFVPMYSICRSLQEQVKSILLKKLFRPFFVRINCCRYRKLSAFSLKILKAFLNQEQLFLIVGQNNF